MKKVSFSLELGAYISIFLVLATFIAAKALNAKPSKEITARINEMPLTDVVFLEKRIKLDSIREDSVVNMTYRIVNTGTNNLKILKVNPDCICTSHHETEEVIQPSDTTEIILSFKAKGHVGKNTINALVALNTERKFYKISSVINVIP